jgi:hypothetical protein
MIRVGLGDNDNELEPHGTLKSFLDGVVKEQEDPEAEKHIKLAERVQSLYGGDLNYWLRLYDQELYDKIRMYESK